MPLTLSISDRISGVPLSTDAKLPTPSLVPTAGQNRLTVSWSKSSGQAAREFVELHVQYTVTQGFGPVRNLQIDWGDGTVENFYVGSRTFDRFYTHTYTSTASTIAVTIDSRDIGAGTIQTMDGNIGFVPELSADYTIDQVQFEKYRDEVQDFRPDWANTAEVASTFVDTDVRRGFRYKYRVKARAAVIGKRQTVRSAFSEMATIGPWV